MRSRRDVKVVVDNNNVVRHRFSVKRPHPFYWLTILDLDPYIFVNAVSPACSVTASVPLCALDMVVYAGPFNIVYVADPKSFVEILLQISPGRHTRIREYVISLTLVQQLQQLRVGKVDRFNIIWNSVVG